jgi:hypothetical protein
MMLPRGFMSPIGRFPICRFRQSLHQPIVCNSRISREALPSQHRYCRYHGPEGHMNCPSVRLAYFGFTQIRDSHSFVSIQETHFGMDFSCHFETVLHCLRCHQRQALVHLVQALSHPGLCTDRFQRSNSSLLLFVFRVRLLTSHKLKTCQIDPTSTMTRGSSMSSH